MTPSTAQRGGDDAGGYDSEAEKMVAEKNDATLAALIRGIEEIDRALAYQHAIATADGTRTDAMAALNRRLRQLRETEAGGDRAAEAGS